MKRFIQIIAMLTTVGAICVSAPVSAAQTITTSSTAAAVTSSDVPTNTDDLRPAVDAAKPAGTRVYFVSKETIIQRLPGKITALVIYNANIQLVGGRFLVTSPDETKPDTVSATASSATVASRTLDASTPTEIITKTVKVYVPPSAIVPVYLEGIDPAYTIGAN